MRAITLATLYDPNKHQLSREMQAVADDGQPVYFIDAEVLYPRMIAVIVNLLEHPENRDGTESERHYLSHAIRLSKTAWLDALREEGAADLSLERAIERATALEIARKFYTAKLREESGESMGIKITTDDKDRWKLGVQVEV